MSIVVQCLPDLDRRQSLNLWIHHCSLQKISWHLKCGLRYEFLRREKVKIKIQPGDKKNANRAIVFYLYFGNLTRGDVDKGKGLWSYLSDPPADKMITAAHALWNQMLLSNRRPNERVILWSANKKHTLESWLLIQGNPYSSRNCCFDDSALLFYVSCEICVILVNCLTFWSQS